MRIVELARNEELFKSIEIVDQNLSLTVPVEKPSTLRIGGKDCKYCPGATFIDQDEFREHYQSAWHLHNQERVLKKNRTAISLEHYEALPVEDSDSSDFWEEEEREDGDCGLSDEEEDEESLAISPILYFKVEQDTFGIQRSLLFSSKHEYRKTTTISVDLLKAFLTQASTSTWTIIMIKSGRVFVGIYDLSTDKFTHHRAIKKYTERRKQGGSQMLRDKSGKVGRSAGSQLRRKNEVDLIAELNGIMKEWSPIINKSQLIFWNRTLFSQLALFQSANSVLSKDDPRLRTYPFTTFKPGIEEALRCARLLSTLSVNKSSIGKF